MHVLEGVDYCRLLLLLDQHLHSHLLNLVFHHLHFVHLRGFFEETLSADFGGHLAPCLLGVRHLIALLGHVSVASMVNLCAKILYGNRRRRLAIGD